MNQPADPNFKVRAAQAASAAGGESDLPELPGYDLVDLIGRGGMGVVYEAFQRSTGRRVAVKLLPDLPAGANDSTITGDSTLARRLEREVELSSRLTHPGIVSVIDAGAHHGKPFLVMEFVEGVALDEFVEPGKADVRAAARIMAEICEAVDYAHQRGVLHRDLKPSNVLVNKSGRARVLDFGLAKAIDPVSVGSANAGGAEKGGWTLSEPGQLLGTLAYMPPEQARGEAAQISVRSDVYSLGAIGYKLVTGRLACPIDGPMSGVLAGIEGVDPARASSVRRGVPRDLDAILARALEKSPGSRYATAGELGADLKRFLEDKPIAARPVGLGVRGWRWARRNKRVSITTGVAAALIVAIAGYSFWRVSHELHGQVLLNGVLHDLDEVSGAGSGRDRQTVVAGMEALSLKVGSEFGDYPKNEATLRTSFTRKYKDFFAYDKAELEAQRALELWRRVRGERSVEYAEALTDLGNAQYFLEQFESAAKHGQEAMAILKGVSSQPTGRMAEAESLVGGALQRLGRYVEARNMYADVLAIRQKLAEGAGGDLADRRNNVANAMNNLATACTDTGEYLRAEGLCREGLDLYARRKDFAARCQNNLAMALMYQGPEKHSDAEEMFRRAAEGKRETTGEMTPSYAVTLLGQAELKLLQGRAEEAEMLAGQAEVIVGSGTLYTAAAQVIRGQCAMERGQVAEARDLFESAPSIRAGLVREWHPLSAEVRAMLTDCWSGQERAASAEGTLVDAVAVLSAARSTAHHRTREAVQRLVRLYEERADSASAEKYRAMLRDRD